jgi:formimidoylglutamate deiminase
LSVVAPELLYLDGRFQRGLCLSFEDGLITGVGPGAVQQRGRALIPGLINAHSHAFQRVIRGRTELRNPDHPHDDFWSWREQMYQAAMTLSPERLETVARLLFLEMVASGITCVGEFHYLHHGVDGPYADPNELAWRVLRAAEWAGCRMVLLRVAYHRSGFGLKPDPRQLRFLDPSPEYGIESLEALRKAGVRVGVAPHSVRAVPGEWLKPLHDYARQHDLPYHMHISEQPRELAECRAEYGRSPVEFAADQGLIDERFTGVHAIHLEPHEFELLRGANVCACPTTERNLGDGIVAADRLLAAGCSLALGSDSQCQINLLEDARQLEYHLRLQRRQRAFLPAARLLDCATQGGARALKVPAGRFEVGRWADWVEIDLEHPALATDDPEEALAGIVFGLPQGAVAQVCVGGQPRLLDGRHPLQRQAVADFRRGN